MELTEKQLEYRGQMLEKMARAAEQDKLCPCCLRPTDTGEKILEKFMQKPELLSVINAIAAAFCEEK